jgi:xylan 1,4-beta-xylosidase
MRSDRGRYDEVTEKPVPVQGWKRVYLKATLNHDRLLFWYGPDEERWMPTGPVLDASKISDEYAEANIGGHLLDQGFTGAFLGMCVQDLSGRGKHADFDYYTYREFDGS